MFKIASTLTAVAVVMLMGLTSVQAAEKKKDTMMDKSSMGTEMEKDAMMKKEAMMKKAAMSDDMKNDNMKKKDNMTKTK